MSSLPLEFVDGIDAFFMDDLGQMNAGDFGALRPHIQAGKVTRDSFRAEIGEVAAGAKPGRKSADETILFWHRGLATSDIALGVRMLELARGTRDPDAAALCVKSTRVSRVKPKLSL